LGTDFVNGELTAVLPPLGAVYKLNVVTNSVEILWSSEELHSLAGIISIDKDIHVAQLFEMRSRSLDDLPKLANDSSNQCCCCVGGKDNDKSIVTWQGNEVGDGEDTYFLDNLDTMDNRYIIGSIYRSMKTSQVPVMKSSCISVFGWGFGKLVTCIWNAITCAPNNKLNNAELLLQFSTQDVFDDLCLVVCDPKTKVSKHFKYSNITAFAKERGVDFDGHTTDASHHNDQMCFVNFKSKYVLLMNINRIRAAFP